MLAGTAPGNRVRLRPSLRAATNSAATTSQLPVCTSRPLGVWTHLGESAYQTLDESGENDPIAQLTHNATVREERNTVRGTCASLQ
jgi:hypothetical protein